MSKKAYFIFDARVHDPDKMAPYHANAAATIEAYGGKCLVLGGAQETVEGTPPDGALVVLEFESLDQARRWYNSPEYQAILPYRKAAAQTHAWLVEGAV